MMHLFITITSVSLLAVSVFGLLRMSNRNQICREEIAALESLLEGYEYGRWGKCDEFSTELKQVKDELADKKAKFERLKIDASVASEALVRMESMFNEKADELYKLKEKYQQVLFDNHRIKMEVTEMCGDLMAIAKMADSQSPDCSNSGDYYVSSDPPF